MNIKKTIYMALGATLMLTACAQDEFAKDDLPGDGNTIYFRSYLPDVTLARATEVTTLSNCQVTCFNPTDSTLITESMDMNPYFADNCFANDGSGRYYSTEGDYIWPDANSRLHFFAYYPSVASMNTTSADTLFNLVNSSKLVDEGPAFDYRLEKFRVATDIAEQVDFVTAYAAGTLAEDGNEGIRLDFKHQLARVDLMAWGANDKYDFEIAGVRIGNPIIGGDFFFTSLSSAEEEVAPWQNFAGQKATVEHIFSAGTSVVVLSKTLDSHATEENAASIMGSAGAAMVLPTGSRIEAWEGKADPATALPGYTTDKMYFSVLLRVKNKAGEVAYPYPNASEKTKIIYLAVEKDSKKISQRLYKIGSSYYTSSVESEATLYIAADNEEICGFSWAAIPVPAKWDAAKKYTYKLNYSNGIGWHDPDDPEPGEPIIERGGIPFTVNVTDWVSAHDYNSDITVPKR